MTVAKPDPGTTAKVRMLVLQMVEALVDDVDSVELRTEELNGSICFRVQVSPSDIGKLIGKEGRTARSIRTILGAASMKTGHRYTLDILHLQRSGVARYADVFS